MKMESRMDRKAFVILCILFLLVLIPIFWIAMYVYPSADDLSYGAAAAHVWKESHSLTSVFSTAWEGAMEKYQTWQGSFFAVFLMTRWKRFSGIMAGFTIPFSIRSPCSFLAC